MASVLNKEQGGEMAPTAVRPAEMNAVICIFNMDKEGCNGVSLIKTDIYYRLGWLWFAAISKWTQEYGRTGSTFQNKPQVSFSNIRPVPTGSTDPTDRFIYHLGNLYNLRIKLNANGVGLALIEAHK